MGRRWRVFVAIVAVAGGWLAFGKDAMRERVVHSVADLAGRAVAAAGRRQRTGVTLPRRSVISRQRSAA